MKTLVKNILTAVVLLTTNINAGGKSVVPVDAPIVPIVTVAPSFWYIGGGLVWAKLHGCDMVNCSYEDVTYGAMLRGGYDFNEYFGVEARGMRTFLDKGPFGGTPLQHIGLYARPQYPISEHINIYVLVGYGYTENLGNGARLNYFDNDHGFSAGIGLEYDLSGRKLDGHEEEGWSLFLDFQRLLIKSNVPDLDTFSFGVKYDF